MCIWCWNKGFSIFVTHMFSKPQIIICDCKIGNEIVKMYTMDNYEAD